MEGGTDVRVRVNPPFLRERSSGHFVILESRDYFEPYEPRVSVLRSAWTTHWNPSTVLVRLGGGRCPFNLT